jgi:selenocysteine lyase/cysteine desulfurase
VFASETQKSGSNSLVVKGEHNSDIAMLLDAQGIAVRSGTHCAMPLMSSLQCNGTIRVSFSVYNTLEEAKAFIMALQSVIHMLQE